jgi:hypothetical protein
MAKDSKCPRTGTPSEATKLMQQKILEMYRDTPNFRWISQELGLSDTYVKKLYRMALKSIIVDNVEDMRRLEAKRLDRLHEKAMQVLEAFHPVVSSGQVVRDIIEDANGRPMIDPATDLPMTYRLQDQGPLLAAIDRVVKVSERRSKLFGLDMPTKTTFTDPTGEKEASFVQFYIPSNNRDAEEAFEEDE